MKEEVPRKKKPINIDTYVKQHLRKASLWWPPRAEALRKAKVAPGRWACEHCGKVCKNIKSDKSIKKKDRPRKEYELDHKLAVIPLDGKIMRENDRNRLDLNKYVDRLLVPAEGFSVLCRNCHDSKSASENLMREFYKKENKND